MSDNGPVRNPLAFVFWLIGLCLIHDINSLNSGTFTPYQANWIAMAVPFVILHRKKSVFAWHVLMAYLVLQPLYYVTVKELGLYPPPITRPAVVYGIVCVFTVFLVTGVWRARRTYYEFLTGSPTGASEEDGPEADET